MKQVDYSTKNINSFWAYLIVEELIRNQVTYFCISPGSRSTPLTIAAATHPAVESTICYDERGASYFAIGYARAVKKPAVVICTSGTALANCLPAVIEASNDMIPIIIISADRPPELRETGANQTIDQVKIFQNYTRWEHDLPCPTEAIKPAMVLTTIDQAIYRSITITGGPVHINCMFRDPLIPLTQPISKNYLSLLSTWYNSRIPYTSYAGSLSQISTYSYKDLAKKINKIKKGILVAGKLNTKEEQNAVVKLSERLGWPVFADILSGLRLQKSIKTLLSYFDQFLLSESFSVNIKPDMILHLGGKITSKRFNTFIEKQVDLEYIRIKNHPARFDDQHKVSIHIQSDLLTFCSNIISHLHSSINSSWSEQFYMYNTRINKKIDQYLGEDDKLNEISLARILSKQMQKDHGLFLANSMPIRDMDMYGALNSDYFTIDANRGASGIDGTIATAAGFTAGLKKPVTVILGDLALLHDLNSLSILHTLKVPFLIIVINNHGGGIFSFLPVANFPDLFEEYFAAAHSMDFKFITKMFNIDYQQPVTIRDFIDIFRKKVKNNRPCLIEIQTNRKKNYQLHENLQKKIIKILEKI